MSKFSKTFQKYLVTELEMKESQAAMQLAFKRLKGATNIEDKERFLNRCKVTKAKFEHLLNKYYELEKLYQKEIEEISKRENDFVFEAKNNIFLKDAVKEEKNDSNSDPTN